MTSKLDIQFKEAVEKISKTEEKLPPDILLRLYAYYKQAIKGDNFLYNYNDKDIRDAFKFNAWMQLKGMSENQAKQEYINLANTIFK
ncbi:acyl-CoA-binding protein [Tenacibaculum adriaticum]|uniref:Acyl-CoA-binding protein n=1 Tax=Tenacibaculum adriaticum TaxID=413713 RepID=A0A5S5DNR0_9FLAO|nr:acyl-CoA-binding protein [Tenacibaculum adriaticum]TYP96452.1 acyl-CoA-binding protein [Tenacibaculum adriaticum]